MNAGLSILEPPGPKDRRLQQSRPSSLAAARSVLVSRLTSTCQPLDQHLISHTMIIYSAPRSSSQPLDLCLLSPTTSAYSAKDGLDGGLVLQVVLGDVVVL